MASRSSGTSKRTPPRAIYPSSCSRPRPRMPTCSRAGRPVLTAISPSRSTPWSCSASFVAFSRASKAPKAPAAAISYSRFTRIAVRSDTVFQLKGWPATNAGQPFSCCVIARAGATGHPTRDSALLTLCGAHRLGRYRLAHQLLKLTGLTQLTDDIASTPEFAANEDLRNGGPARKDFNAFPRLLVLQHVDIGDGRLDSRERVHRTL